MYYYTPKGTYMKDKESPLSVFLNKHQLNIANLNFAEDCEKFMDEMETGLSGKSSLEMVPTFIEEASGIPEGKPVLVLDAGGTNFRAAIVTFTEDYKPEIKKFRKTAMPGIEKELSKTDFYNAIVDFIEELAPLADRIGFCFSYAMEKTPEKDGVLIKFSKEVKAPEVQGSLVGKEVLNVLRCRGIDNIKKIVMLNDTVATLLAGKASGGVERFDDYIGLIIGTGLNASYNELNSNITKLPDLPENGSQIINMETGSYSHAPFGDIDKEFRDSTVSPSSYHFEKMISGAYQGPLCLKAMETAAEEGFFSYAFRSAIRAAEGTKDAFTTADLSGLFSNQRLPGRFREAANGDDTEAVLSICGAVLERAAYLSAVKLAAIILKTGKGRTAEKPICICADGSTFWKLTGFKGKIEHYLSEYLGNKAYFRFIGIDNAPVIGAAVAGLTN